jgi:hypothetical protein
MKTLSELPKSVIITQSVLELQLGIAPQKEYVLEVISTRTIKHKVIHVKATVDKQGYYRITAPAGYRISRMWVGHVGTDTELVIG